MTKDHPAARLAWAGKCVDWTAIDAELSLLWRMSSDNVRTSQNLNVRTSVLNFVICVSDRKAAQRVHALLRDLASTHLARVILLILSPEEDAPARAWVTLRSFSIISDLMRHNFEQITILIPPSEQAHAASTLANVLKPDLPFYLWWDCDLPTETDLFAQLSSHAQRVIIDSNCFSRPESRLRTLTAFVQHAERSVLSDLNWGRVHPWRELIAQFFDVNEYKPYLAGIQEIEIEHAISPDASSANPIQALLIASWLTTRLGWQLQKESPLDQGATNDRLIWYRRSLSDQAPVRLSIKSRPHPGLEVGGLCAIRLQSRLTDSQATFTIYREDHDPEHVFTEVEIGQEKRSQRTVHLASTLQEHMLLHDELEIMQRDHLYEEILEEIFRLLTSIGKQELLDD